MPTLQLTDDELVAIALDRGSFWPSVLPTVDTGDAAFLADCAFRGQRSLAVRGLLDEYAEPVRQIRDLVWPLTGVSGLVSAYLGDEELRPVASALATSHYPTAGWIRESTDPVGVHRFSREGESDHWAYLEALLVGAVADGPVSRTTDVDADGDAPDGPVRLCVGVERASGRVIATARRAEVTVVRLMPGETAVTVLEGPATETRPAILRLKQAVEELMTRQ